MTSPAASASDSSTERTAHSTKWFKRRALERQNIAEGSRVSGTSKELEIKLTNVARASLEELLLDYEDYLRVRQLPVWSKDSREARYVARLARVEPLHFDSFREIVETRDAKVVANIAICLIKPANYLLDQQIRRLESDFITQGGLRENMTRARLEQRSNRNSP